MLDSFTSLTLPRRCAGWIQSNSFFTYLRGQPPKEHHFFSVIESRLTQKTAAQTRRSKCPFLQLHDAAWLCTGVSNEILCSVAKDTSIQCPQQKAHKTTWGFLPLFFPEEKPSWWLPWMNHPCEIIISYIFWASHRHHTHLPGKRSWRALSLLFAEFWPVLLWWQLDAQLLERYGWQHPCGSCSGTLGWTSMVSFIERTLWTTVVEESPRLWQPDLYGARIESCPEGRWQQMVPSNWKFRAIHCRCRFPISILCKQPLSDADWQISSSHWTPKLLPWDRWTNDESVASWRKGFCVSWCTDFWYTSSLG